jgi:maltodextrin utilization protein YvdJ
MKALPKQLKRASVKAAQALQNMQTQMQSLTGGKKKRVNASKKRAVLKRIRSLKQNLTQTQQQMQTMTGGEKLTQTQQ